MIIQHSNSVSKPLISLEMQITSPQYWKRISDKQRMQVTLYCRMCLLQFDHSYMHNELRNVSLLIPYLTHVCRARLSYITMETVFSVQSFRSTCSSLPRRTCVRNKEQTWLPAGRGPSSWSWSDSSAMSMVCAECLQQTVIVLPSLKSTQCSAANTCTQLCLLYLQPADLLQRGSVDGSRWLNSGRSPCLPFPVIKENLMTIPPNQKIRTDRQSKTIEGWIDQPEESDFCPLMQEQLYPLKSSFLFKGGVRWDLLVKSCVRSGILSSVNTEAWLKWTHLKAPDKRSFVGQWFQWETGTRSVAPPSSQISNGLDERSLSLVLMSRLLLWC